MKKQTKRLILLLIAIITVVIAFLLDNFLLKAIPHIRISPINPIFIFLGGTMGLITYIIFLSLFLFYERKKKFIFYLLTTVFSAGIISYILKIIIMRPRPEIIPLIIKTTSSFPSAHALIAASTIPFIKKLKHTKILAFIPAILIILTGYYNGVHYPSDILAGVFLGTAASHLILNKIPLNSKKIKQKTKRSGN